MEFEWDETKAETNLRKHGVAFEDALAVFEDERQFTEPAKTTGGEMRWKTTGRADRYAVLSIVHTARVVDGVEVIRLISARPASRRERRLYDGQ